MKQEVKRLILTNDQPRIGIPRIFIGMMDDRANGQGMPERRFGALTKGIISDNERQIEEIALAAEHERTAAQFAHETRTQAHDHAADHLESHLDRIHEATMQVTDQAHQTATDSIQQQADQQEAEAGREHELALQPSDTDSGSDNEPT